LEGTLVQKQFIIGNGLGQEKFGIMPRQPRLDAPETLHHVTGRENEGSEIFKKPGDREDFLDRIAKLCEAKALSVLAWAWLDTHFHLLEYPQPEDSPTGHFLEWLLNGKIA
jgi:REP element-mobilizing transposase RayT